MGGKKKAGGKGKKKDDGGDDGSDLSSNPAALAKAFEMQNTALRRELAERSETALQAMKAKRELQERVEDLRKDFGEEQKATFEITANMTRQYKAMQEQLLSEIQKLERTIDELKGKLEESKAELERTRREKDAAVASKDEEIAQMREKMEDMATEFGEMLQETLKKMSERIEVSNPKWEAETGIPVLRKMEEFSSAAPAR